MERGALFLRLGGRAGRMGSTRRRCQATGAGAPLDLLARVGELARRPGGELTSSDVRTALSLHAELGSLPPELVPAAGQQLLRSLLAYRGWSLPTVLRQLPGGPERWHTALLAPGAAEGGPQLLPLASDDEAFARLRLNSLRGEGGAPIVEPLTVSGGQAVDEYLPSPREDDAKGRLQGLVLNPGEEGEELILGKERLALLRSWMASLRLEAMMAEGLPEGVGARPEKPASRELSAAFVSEVKLSFVRTPDGADLMRGASEKDFLVLTSPDAAALCASAYGPKSVRGVTPQELLDMARRATDFGYALTLGPDQSRRLATGDAAHVPSWQVRTVDAAWMEAALSSALELSE